MLVHVSRVTRDLAAVTSNGGRLPVQRVHSTRLADIHSSSSRARVLIVHSNGTHLNQLAHAVHSGALEVVQDSSLVRIRTVSDASFADDVLWADAVVIGSHVINANVEPQVSLFLSSWDFSADLSHKVGAVFVTGGGISAGEELTMVNLLHSMMIFRMIIVGGERWTSAFGASGIVGEGPFQAPSPRSQQLDFPTDCYPNNPDMLHDMFTAKGISLGRRVASVASALAQSAQIIE
ncbi:hypothetical protein PINS_up017538 [Pythium insidiosum]|nr:hypothetical protein PINS_up017538 [Pythium insidiosum]